MRTIKDQVRTLKAHLEYNLKIKFDPEDAILQWLAKWAGTMLNRYLVGRDGRTAYKRMRTRRCTALVAQFGEAVVFKMLKQERASWGDEVEHHGRWAKGIWIGRSWN